MAARVRNVAAATGVFSLLGLGVASTFADLPGWLSLVLAIGGIAALAVGLVLSYAPIYPSLSPRPLASPVAGRWSALNSPGTRVPSHATHSLGQTFALDLIHEPEPDARPAFGDGPGFRPPEDFPGFGEPVLAPADGRVVAVEDRVRDHLSRSSWPALAYMLMGEGLVRELAGPRRAIGNHVVLDLEDGTYVVLAHLQQGSAAVTPGRHVRRGEPVGRCGNSGNSSEPHLHIQLMDKPSAFLAAGLPFSLTDVTIEGPTRRAGLPANGRVMIGHA